MHRGNPSSPRQPRAGRIFELLRAFSQPRTFEDIVDGPSPLWIHLQTTLDQLDGVLGTIALERRNIGKALEIVLSSLYLHGRLGVQAFIKR